MIEKEEESMLHGWKIHIQEGKEKKKGELDPLLLSKSSFLGFGLTLSQNYILCQHHLL